MLRNNVCGDCRFFNPDDTPDGDGALICHYATTVRQLLRIGNEDLVSYHIFAAPDMGSCALHQEKVE